MIPMERNRLDEMVTEDGHETGCRKRIAFIVHKDTCPTILEYQPDWFVSLQINAKPFSLTAIQACAPTCDDLGNGLMISTTLSVI